MSQSREIDDSIKNHPRAVLTPEQQAQIALAASEAMANMALVLPPIMEQFQRMAAETLPIMAKAFEPLYKAIKEMNLKPGDLETLALQEIRAQASELERDIADSQAAERGEAFAQEMSDGQTCYKCNPPRQVAPGNIEHHNKVVHYGGKDKVPHLQCLRCNPNVSVPAGKMKEHMDEFHRKEAE